MYCVVEIWNMKNELIETLSHKISVTERNIAFRKKKKMLKQCLKEVIYKYILAFVGRWFIFWEVLVRAGYVLAGGGWWWIYIGWW